MRSEQQRPRAAGSLLALLLLAAVPLSAQVLERILAVVGDTPVLLSEVALLERLRGLSREAALELAIDQRLMLAEAQRVAAASVTPEEEQQAYESLRARFSAADEESEAELRRLASRELRVLRYIEYRFRPLVRVDDAGLLRAWALEHPEAPPPARAEAEALRARLESRDLDAKVEAWVAELRAAAEIRYNR
jgi:hypothetical protein